MAAAASNRIAPMAYVLVFDTGVEGVFFVVPLISVGFIFQFVSGFGSVSTFLRLSENYS